MFGDYNVETVTVPFTHDPAADDVLPVWRAPQACEVTAAYARTANDVSGDTDNWFDVALQNGGTGGTGTTELAGTIGGTAGWSALEEKAFTISEGTLAAGEHVNLKYNEEGTGTYGVLVIGLEVKYGGGYA